MHVGRPFFVVILSNLAIATGLYLALGWHFIRGYNEVSTFIAVGAVVALAAINLVAMALYAGYCRLRGEDTGKSVLFALAFSVVILMASPLFVPLIGSIAKRYQILKTPLGEAARYGDVDQVMRLVQSGHHPDSNRSAHGMTALHYMCWYGNIDAIETMLSHGADVNAVRDGWLTTPLHMAVRSRVDPKIVGLLVDHGADLTVRNVDGKTPIDFTKSIPDPLRSEYRAAMNLKPNSTNEAD